ncbi:monovalent cation:proton antiporter-2 (CPA2) family protein [Longimicrobium sp.]|uniref:monovalent cation:proton antiporter-2 (CPA2) family protein n=1 Tax=Longimicrobium sp. TaxID=2029185 RepID=UPI003B3B91E3
MEEAHLLRPVLVILIAAIAVVSLFRRVKVSPVVGYLFAGVLIGPHGLGLVTDVEAVEALAEFGVVFLLFAIGLELSIGRLLAMRRHVFGMGTLQVALSAVLITALARLAGLTTAEALVLGGAMALSSTAVVMRTLQEDGAVHGRAGRMALAVLLLQDLAVVPLLTVIPLLGAQGGSLLRELGIATLKAAAALGIIMAAGRLLLRPVLRGVAAARTPELFTGITLFLVLGVSWATALAGLSMALGAFLAGLLISETEYRHQVEADIAPFRGLLLALFFMAIGMGIDVGVLAGSWHVVGAGVLAVLAAKAIVVAGLARAFGQPWGTAVFLGFALSQAGEFGFVLVTLATTAKALSAETGELAMLVIAVSIAVTPLLMRAGHAAARRVHRTADADAELAGDARDLRRHVLILGLGRVGRTVVQLLKTTDRAYLALDRDAEAVAEGRARGIAAYFGDGSQPQVLRAAGVERASVVVITLDDTASALRALHAIRAEDHDVPVIARARDTAQCEILEGAGATAVVPELVEGSLQLGGRLLLALGEAEDAVEAALDEMRRDRYRLLADTQKRDDAAAAATGESE